MYVGRRWGSANTDPPGSVPAASSNPHGSAPSFTTSKSEPTMAERNEIELKRRPPSEVIALHVERLRHWIEEQHRKEGITWSGFPLIHLTALQSMAERLLKERDALQPRAVTWKDLFPVLGRYVYHTKIPQLKSELASAGLPVEEQPDGPAEGVEAHIPLGDTKIPIHLAQPEVRNQLFRVKDGGMVYLVAAKDLGDAWQRMQDSTDHRGPFYGIEQVDEEYVP